MCRWFVYISADEECLLEDVLVTPTHGISKMVNDHYLPGLIETEPSDNDATKEIAARNAMLNIDGLGLAFYGDSRSNFNRNCSGPRPTMYKSILTPLNDFNYRNICANTSTRLLFAHIRASSGSAVTPINCHPFVFGRHTFMHNGSVAGFVDIRRELCLQLDRDTYTGISGSSDSEHLAALYISILTKKGGKVAWEEEFSLEAMVSALCEAIGIVIQLQLATLGKDARPNSLNLAVTDGNRLICCRFRNHKTQQAPSLYWSTSAGQTLNRKYPDQHDGTQNEFATKETIEHGKHLIVASEPTTYKEHDWHLMENNSYITAEKGSHIVHAAIPYQETWTIDDDSFAAPKGLGEGL